MINLPYHAASMSQVTPCQNVPVQTSQYNFPTCQQRQTSAQQMQTTACGPCSGVSQGPCARVCQPDTCMVTHQYAVGAQPVTSPCQPVFQSPPYGAPSPGCPGYSQLPQNILDQIRACVSNAAPIFILPGNCQQSPASQQQQLPAPPQATTSPPTTAYPQPGGLAYPPPPPSFYPYPVPLPFCDPFVRARETAQNCGCCGRRDPLADEARYVPRADCRYEGERDEHRCAPTTDDTICAKRNCPSSLHLQALASQFLSMQGIIACAATRLVLRKVPGSNVTATMEDTMAKAQRSINVLTKDQLLSESRNAQQVNALINLHMTANPPPNIIPILTLIQLKMNLLKAQVEGLVNQKLMETQGVGVEVDTELIDPTVLALKSDAELRDFLSVLRQKECDERVNVNFAPYRSQRAIAETRLSNVQSKLRQVEAEFERRRCAMLPAPTLSSRVVQAFSRPCHSARFADPRRRLYGALPPSPDPFPAAKSPSPKRLLLRKRCERTSRTADAATSSARDDRRGTKEQSVATERRPGAENCTCYDRTTSEESVCETKKKLRPRIVEIDATASDVAGGLREVASPVRLTPDVRARIAPRKCRTEGRDEGTSRKGVVCESESGCWLVETYVDEDSESDAIAPGGRVDDAPDVICESRDATAIRDVSEGPTEPRRPVERAEAEIVISEMDGATGRPDVRTEREETSQIEQVETRATTVAEIADEGRISSTEETERKDDGVYTSSLHIVLKPKTERPEDDQRKDGGNDQASSSLTTNETEEQRGATKVIRKKKRIRFHILSLLTNIKYDKGGGYEKEQKIEKPTTNEREKVCAIADPDIEKLSKYSSVDDLLRNAIGITEKDRWKDTSPERLNLSKSHVNRQCQTIFKTVQGNKNTLLKENIFPPFKHLRAYAVDNEKNEDDAGTYSSPITEANVTTAAEGFSRCNNVTENTLGTLCEDNAPYVSGVECRESFISEIFSLIGNRVVTLIDKIITLNGNLHSNRAISRKSISRNGTSIRDLSKEILKDCDPLTATFHYPLDPNQGISRHSRDANLLRASTGEGYDKIHKMKHSIIEDRKNGTKYLLISTSSHNQDLQSTRDLGHPYEVRRSLLIRSRLKSSINSQDNPHPFSLLKRTKKNIFESYQTKSDDSVGMIEKKICELKASEGLQITSGVTTISGNNDRISERRKLDNKFTMKDSDQYNDNITERISHNLYDDTGSDTFINQERAVSDEIVINVHDYLGLQTEINSNIYENHSPRLLITDKTVESFKDVS